MNQILQVKIPDETLTDPAFPDLSGIPPANILCCIGDSTDLERVVAFITQHAKNAGTSLVDKLPDRWVDEQHPRGSECASCLLVEGYGIRFSLDTGGWQVVESGAGFNTALDYTGSSYKRRMSGNDVGMQIGVWSDLSQERVINSDDSLDDRDLYEHLLEFANRYTDKHELDCHGVHLVFLHGHSHPALT